MGKATQGGFDGQGGIDLSSFQLTDDQRRAVEYDGGPVVVLAGPGTGKTRVITARVAHMIAARGISPDQIVAVTFTNKAAGELGDRLGELVGTATACRVVSSTFHSLGLGIVRRFGDVMGLPSNPMLIDSAQRRGLVREIIREHKLYRRSIGLGVEHAIEHAIGTINKLRHQGMMSVDASAWLDRRRAGLGELDGEQRTAAEAELDRFGQAVGVYGHYERGCRDRGWMDFDDLILLPSRLIAEHPSIAAILRQDHRHVVVDEFQDVNAAQIEMIRQLCPPTSNPDLCVVGDDDQSIYGFRGADDRAFARFTQLWDQPETVTLSTNFRSAEAIVEASNEIIDRADVRFDPNKEADSHQGAVDGAGVELVKVEDDKQSGEVIASMLLQMVSRAMERGEELRFGDCAVIARTSADLERIARVLTLEGIPIEIRQRRSPMDDEGVRDVMAWARLLGDPGLSVDIKRILVRPPYRCDAIELGRLVAGWKAVRSRWLAGDPESADPGGLLDWLVAHGDEKMSGKVCQMQELAKRLAQMASESGAGDAIMEIVKSTGVVHGELGDGHQRASRVASIIELVRFAKSRQERFDSPGDLASMLRYMEDLDPSDKALGELPEDMVSSSDHQFGQDHDMGAVAMLTAHASKGLEFDTVFIPRVMPSHGYPKTSSPGGDDEVLPDGLVDRAGDKRDEKARKLDEERRVFYVALTRAHRRAILLAKLPKRSTSVNFALELREAIGDRLIEHESSEVLGSGSMSDVVSQLGMEFQTASKIRDVFGEARRDARLRAALAIDAMELGEIDRDEGDARLLQAGRQIALVRAVYSCGQVPEWADGELADLGRRLVDVLEKQEFCSEKLHAGLEGPLRLSFSQLSMYIKCPRCYLVKYVLGMPEDEQTVMTLGTAVHETLEAFYTLWAQADVDGQEKPGLEKLDELMRRFFFKHWPAQTQVDEDLLEKACVMMVRMYEDMHDESMHIEELERERVFGYQCDGVMHKIKAKIDRVDATSSGGRRVIDYKTGYPKQDLKNPKGTDLQLGIYVMALEDAFGDLGPGSVCEYWLLQDGSKGSIGVDALKMDKIREKIDKAIRGMLAGEWEQGRLCQSGQSRGGSLCSILDQPLSIDGSEA